MTSLLRLFLSAFAATALLACSPGGDEAPADAALSVPELADQLIADAGDVAAMLADVDSAETAEALLPRLEALGETYRERFERFESQNADLGFGDITALASRLPRLTQVQASLAQQIERIRTEHPEAAAVLEDALRDIGQGQP